MTAINTRWKRLPWFWPWRGKCVECQAPARWKVEHYERDTGVVRHSFDVCGNCSTPASTGEGS